VLLLPVWSFIVNAVPSLKKGDNIANLGVVASTAPL
jgi:hypothetical protein